MTTQFAATLSLNSKQFREKSGQVLIMWGTLMLGAALQTRFLVGEACVQWQDSQVDSPRTCTLSYIPHVSHTEVRTSVHCCHT